jgi:hypothetical protein
LLEGHPNVKAQPQQCVRPPSLSLPYDLHRLQQVSQVSLPVKVFTSPAVPVTQAMLIWSLLPQIVVLALAAIWAAVAAPVQGGTVFGQHGIPV